MAKKYLTPDFDVTVYEIKDILTVSVGPDMDDDDLFNEGENIASRVGTDID